MIGPTTSSLTWLSYHISQYHNYALNHFSIYIYHGCYCRHLKIFHLHNRGGGVGGLGIFIVPDHVILPRWHKEKIAQPNKNTSIILNPNYIHKYTHQKKPIKSMKIDIQKPKSLTCWKTPNCASRQTNIRE